MEIILSVNKDDIMHELAVTTSYTGAKMKDDEKAWNRISTVDEDKAQLERFWEECRADLCQELIGLIISERVELRASESQTEPAAVAPTIPSVELRHVYEVRLDVSKSFDSALLPSMNLSLFSYFVQGIAAKWYVYTNKLEAGDYADKATTFLDDIHRKAVYKKKPIRPTYDD